VVQARVQVSGLGMWGAVGEGWDGQCSLYTCVNAAEIDAHYQIQLCAACAVCLVWPIVIWVHLYCFFENATK